MSLTQTVPELLTEVSDRLQKSGIEPDVANNEALILVGHVFGVSRSDLRMAQIMGTAVVDLRSVGHCAIYDDGSFESRENLLKALEKRVARRCNHEPLQYIIGHTPFRFLDVAVGPGVFIPRPETELLVQIAIDWLAENSDKSATDNRVARIVDLCAGSGVVGLSLLSELDSRGKVPEVWAVELSAEALQWTQKNSAKVCFAHKNRTENYHLVHADAIDSATLEDLDGTVDVVATNPPYIPEDEIPEQTEVRDFDPPTALYGGSADGLKIPGKIVKRSFDLLKVNGLLVMEHDASQGAVLRRIAEDCGFTNVHTSQDLTGRDRFLVANKGE